MADTKGYESTTVQALRGTEDRTIAKMETAGWELVDRDRGTFRTTLTFRRPRPRKNLPAVAGLGFLLLVAVGGSTLGLLFGDDADTTAPPADAAASSPPAAVVTPAPPAAPAPSGTTWEETADGELAFGETARFRSTAGSSDIPLEITVGPPVVFTPSEAATVFDARDAFGGRPGSLHETTVSFTVTIRNLSTDQAFSPDFVFSDVAGTGADDQVSKVLEGDVVGMTGWPQEIPPGAAFTLEDGYSVQDATAIEYTLEIDGLAGRSFSFSR
ncbi:hypothetical protein GCU60_05980 [Blastococcus saxobsidens]|uniref:DUF4352 domain-containing protein n=1 Tax=Blastococcus saxobsidens TaxID=138336 RepID=A0A6L9W1G2_9ACTN|nr:hypothetical protein [Blastococcus saxobsidens]NEK85311.1 hypothetical protein [Blastococcus saxobsidens]